MYRITKKWFIVFLFCCVAGLASSQDIASGLEGYWSFDTLENNVTEDSSGNERHASVAAGRPVHAAGKIGNALFLDGNSDLANAWKGIAGNAPRTISCWIRTSDIGNGLVGWGPNSTGAKWHFRINNNAADGTAGAVRTEISGSFIIGSTVITDDEWHHVVSVFEGNLMGHVTHYVDGIAETVSGIGNQTLEVNTGADDGSPDLTIGSRVQNNVFDRFRGSLDEVRIYNRALSQTEVSALYEQGQNEQRVAIRSFESNQVVIGGSVGVTLALPTPTSGTLTETLPAGWSASNISNGGTLSGNTITWILTSSVTSVMYTASPAQGTTDNVFVGMFDGNVSDGAISVIVLQGNVGDLNFHTDIGAVGAEGDAEFTNGAYLLRGSGVDIWGPADGFHFAYNEVEGPFTIKGNALVFPFESSSDWVKGGLMVRNNLTPGSSNGMILVRTDLQMSAQARPAQGVASITVRDLAANQLGDMEIQRRGKFINFFYVTDTGERQEYGSIRLDDLEDPVYAGLAITSHENGSISELEFADLELVLEEISSDRSIAFDGQGVPGFGDTLHITVTVYSRTAQALTITEHPPQGWNVTNLSVSTGTVHSNANGEIEWSVSGQQGYITLTYDLSSPTGISQAELVGEFNGSANGITTTGASVVKVTGLLPDDILQQQDITSGLVGHWTFDEGSGTTTADSSGTGKDALVRSGAPGWVNGIKGSALSFDGDDDLYVPDWYGIGGNTPRTVTCWIKSTATNTHAIISWGISTVNGRKYHVRINNNAADGINGALRTEVQGSFNIGTTVINNDQWHFLASVFPEGGQFVTDVQHYVNGLLDLRSGTNANGPTLLLDTAASPEESDQEFRIGMRVQAGADNYYSGLIDEVRIYERALTTAEIQAIMVSEGGPPQTTVSDYMLY